MSNEFEKWPSRFQKPGEEEEDHTLRIETLTPVLKKRGEKMDLEKILPILVRMIRRAYWKRDYPGACEKGFEQACVKMCPHWEFCKLEYDLESGCGIKIEY
jgi:hypothetical protein